MSVLGVDLSLTGTGLALIDCDPRPIQHKYSILPIATCHAHMLPQGLLVRVLPENNEQYDRWRLIRQYVLNLARGVPLVVIEGYAYAAPFQREVLAELGGIIRYALRETYGITPVIVPPATMKRFLLGKGKGEKELMLKECYKRYGVDVDDNNLSDAYVLAKIGEALLGGTDGLPQFQKDVIEQIKNGKPKKTKKVKASPATTAG